MTDFEDSWVYFSAEIEEDCFASLAMTRYFAGDCRSSFRASQ